MRLKSVIAAVMVSLWLGGCAYMPSGPSVMALPGTGLSFNQFQMDDYQCRQYALGQVGGTEAGQAGIDSQVGSAVAGTALGAAAGAALGGGRGAAIGAGTGLVAGTMVGSGTGSSSYYETQRFYDNAYIQCMYAKGHKVPVSGNIQYDSNRVSSPAVTIPPPPAGTPPPPPRP